MQIKTFTLGELQTKTYLIFDENTKEGIIIDPADDANFLSEQVLQLGIKLTAIIATHGHFDHVLAANELQLAFDVPFLINEKDLPLLKKMSFSAAWWLKRRIIEKPPANIQFLSDRVEPCQMKVISTPGHSPGSVCLYSEKDKVLFTGDTLFARGTVGRTDFPYGSAVEMEKSIDKLSLLPAETIIYPGHGESSTLEQTLEKLS